MQFGAPIPYSGPIATPDNLALVAQGAERLGFDYASVGGHLFYPKRMESRYPHTVDRVLNMNPAYANLEMFSALTFVAAHTTRLGLHTRVLPLPWQSPFVTAKQAATLDFLSKGRLVLGVGVGWMREEFDVLQVPFSDRGAIADESIRVLRALWGPDPSSFEGRYFRFHELYAEPKPVQQPLPLWIVGTNQRNLRRVARLGDGWHVSAIQQPETLGPQLDFLRRCLDEEGRDPDGFPVSAKIDVLFKPRGAYRSLYETVNVPPEPAAVLDAVERWRRAGATAIDVHVGSRYEIPVDELLERMQWVAEEVLRHA